jgi:hypothetical protein
MLLVYFLICLRKKKIHTYAWLLCLGLEEWNFLKNEYYFQAYVKSSELNSAIAYVNEGTWVKVCGVQYLK